jgi:hypothetical protein
MMKKLFNKLVLAPKSPDFDYKWQHKLFHTMVKSQERRIILSGVDKRERNEFCNAIDDFNDPRYVVIGLCQHDVLTTLTEKDTAIVDITTLETMILDDFSDVQCRMVIFTNDTELAQYPKIEPEPSFSMRSSALLWEKMRICCSTYKIVVITPEEERQNFLNTIHRLNHPNYIITTDARCYDYESDYIMMDLSKEEVTTEKLTKISCNRTAYQTILIFMSDISKIDATGLGYYIYSSELTCPGSESMIGTDSEIIQS